jgi:hypothetical protein
MFQLQVSHEVVETLQLPVRYERNTHLAQTIRMQARLQQRVDAEDRVRLCRDYLALVGVRKKFCELL